MRASILRDLVRGAEAVEEVEERHARRERGRVGDRGEVVGLLDRARAEQREAGLAAGHDVGVVAEDRERVGGDRAGGDVHAEGRQLAGDLVHVRDHQEQALRRGEGRREAPACSAPWTAPAAPASDCISMTSGTWPQTFVAAVRRPLVAPARPSARTA